MAANGSAERQRRPRLVSPSASGWQTQPLTVSEDGAPPIDPELAALDPQLQAMVKNALVEIMQETDANALREGLTQMTAQAAQAPPAFKPAIDFIVKKVNERIAELEANK